MKNVDKQHTCEQTLEHKPYTHTGERKSWKKGNPKKARRHTAVRKGK